MSSDEAYSFLIVAKSGALYALNLRAQHRPRVTIPTAQDEHQYVTNVLIPYLENQGYLTSKIADWAEPADLWDDNWRRWEEIQ